MVPPRLVAATAWRRREPKKAGCKRAGLRSRSPRAGCEQAIRQERQLGWLWRSAAAGSYLLESSPRPNGARTTRPALPILQGGARHAELSREADRQDRGSGRPHLRGGRQKRQEPTTPTTSPQTGPRPRALLLTVVSVHMKRHSINIRPPGEWKVTGDYSPVLN
jgi:hypothetical protein